MSNHVFQNRWHAGIRILICAWFAMMNALCAAQSTAADTEVTLQADSTREVRKDLLHVKLLVSAVGPNLKNVSEEVSRLVKTLSERWANKSDIGYQEGARRISVRTASSKQSTRFWHVEQEVFIQARPVPIVLDFLQSHPAGVTVASIGAAASPEALKEAEARAENSALELFKQRAQDVQRTMGAAKYTIVSLRVGATPAAPVSVEQPPTVSAPPSARNSRESQAPSEPNAVAVCTVSGTVRLMYDR